MGKKLLVIIAITVAAISCAMQLKNEKEKVLVDYKIEKVKNHYYIVDWDSIQALIDSGLPKSASKKLSTMLEKAIADSNHYEIVKIVEFHLAAKKRHQENHTDSALIYINELLPRLHFPSKQYVELMSADVLGNGVNWSHAEKGESNPLSSYSEWSREFIHDSIIKIQRKILAQIEQTKHLPFSMLSNIDDSKSKVYRTLYDLFLWKMIEQNSYYLAPKTFCSSELKQSFIGTNDEFIESVFNEDECSYVFQLHQLLEQFHNDKKDQAPYLFNKIQRIKKIKKDNILSISEDEYIDILEDLYKNNSGNLLSSDVLFELVRTKLNKLDRKDKTADYQEVLDLAYKGEKSAVVFEDLKGKFEEIQNEIKRVQIEVELQKFNLPNEPIAGTIKFQNLSQMQKDNIVYYDVYEYKELKGKENFNTFIEENDPVMSFRDTLFDDHKYHSWSTYFKIPALEVGKYILFATPTEKYDTRFYTSVTFNVTNLLGVTQQIDKDRFKVEVVNRKTGNPIANCKVTYKHSRSRIDRRKTERTNENGEAIFNYATDYSWGNELFLELDNDKIELNNYNYRNYTSDYVQENNQIFIDREIYRPGQKLYFKSISTTRENKGFSTKPTVSLNKNKSVKMILRDANYEVVWDSTLTTNEFGSISGQVKLDKNKMTGSWRLQVGNSTTSFKVEEYKRPTFEVTFDKVKTEYQFGDSITITGKAKSYSGVPVRDASTKIDIVRSVNNYYFGYHYWRYQPTHSRDEEILSKEIKTNSDGTFSVTFYAKKEKSINYNKQYISYKIDATTTNLTGESKSANTSISVGEKGFQISSSFPIDIDKEGLQKANVKAINLNGEVVNQKLSYIVYESDSKTKPVRTWYLEPVDTLLGGREKFENLFPNQDIMLNKTNESDQDENKKVLSGTLSEEIMNLDEIKKLKSGNYKIKFFGVDKHNNTIEVVNKFNVYANSDRKIKSNQSYITRINHKSFQPGETAKIHLGTKYSDVRFKVNLINNNKLIYSKVLNLDEEITSFEIPIIESYRGGLSLNIVAVKDNDTYRKEIDLHVPYKNKDLDVKFETFRDKTKPGAKEIWKAIVSNPDNTKVAAEMVATLYDASLDELTKNSYISNRSNWSYKFYTANTSNSLFNPSIQSNQNVRGNSDNSTYYSRNWQYHDPFQKYLFELFVDKQFYRMVGTYGNAMRANTKVSKELRKEVAVSESNGLDHTLNVAAGAVSYFYDANADVITDVKSKKPNSKTDFDSTFVEVDFEEKISNIQTRKNFNETAFFFPHLKTNKKGEIIIEFTMPESLTSWNFKGFAHTQDLKSGTLSAKTITQKDFMITSFAPRFFREDDQILFTAKIDNISDEAQKGLVQLQLLDASTLKPIDKVDRNKKFEVNKNDVEKMEWKISVPKNVPAIIYSIKAVSKDFGDGEEKTIPVLKNSMLVRESMPMTVRSGKSKSYDFERMKSATTSTTNHHKYTVEVTANPAWSAVQSLPYMIEFPYECAEQTFSRLYANAITLHLINSNPDIKKMFDTWKSSKQGRDPLMSALEQNEELKTLLLKETPWVKEAKDETEAKQRLAELFDSKKLENEISSAAKRLLDMGYNNGWPWFDGGKVNPYITNHIAAGFGHLQKLGVASEMNKIAQFKILAFKMKRAIKYLDDHQNAEFIERKRKKYEHYLSNNIIHYFYSRSFYLESIPLPKEEWIDVYKVLIKKGWKDRSLQEQAMIALSFHRMGDVDFAKQVMKSLKEHSTTSEDRGMFWEKNVSSYYWWTSSIETQAIMIEAFNEITNDKAAVEDMRIWLLRNKETNSWNSTKATAYASYSLLLGGENWLTDNNSIDISVAGKALKIVNSNPKNAYEVIREPGTGYIKTSWNSSEVKTDLSKIDIKNNGKTVAFGSAYWEYFERLDKITSSGNNPIKINKTLYIKDGTDLTPIHKSKLKIGDKVTVRLSITADREMEFVHIKDMRASTFEPLDAVSQYHYQNGAWYFQSTKDASVDLFFDFVPKGTYTIDYDLYVTHSGEFSNGICTVECMYAPQFTSHTGGMKVVVE